jgi:raffinose/stachyose/melibiose transport system substrate-binding protein
MSVIMASGALFGCNGNSGSDPSKDADAGASSTQAVASNQESQSENEGAVADFSGEDPKLEKDFHFLSIWAEDNDNGILINTIFNDYKAVNDKFDYEFELVAANDLRQKVATLTSSNDLPDMFVYESGKPIVDLIEADKITDIGALLKEIGSTDFVTPSATSLLQTLSNTDTIYDLPLGLNVEGFWYNKALFEQAKIDKAPETWDEFEDVLAKLKEAGIQPLSAGAADKWGANTFG